MTVPVLNVWGKFAAGRPYFDDVVALLQDQIWIHRAMSEHSHLCILPLRAAQEFLPNVERFLVTYTRMGARADRAGDLLWSCPAKFH